MSTTTEFAAGLTGPATPTSANPTTVVPGAGGDTHHNQRGTMFTKFATTDGRTVHVSRSHVSSVTVFGGRSRLTLLGGATVDVKESVDEVLDALSPFVAGSTFVGQAIDGAELTTLPSSVDLQPILDRLDAIEKAPAGVVPTLPEAIETAVNDAVAQIKAVAAGLTGDPRVEDLIKRLDDLEDLLTSDGEPIVEGDEDTGSEPAPETTEPAASEAPAAEAKPAGKNAKK